MTENRTIDLPWPVKWNDAAALKNNNKNNKKNLTNKFKTTDMESITTWNVGLKSDVY